MIKPGTPVVLKSNYGACRAWPIDAQSRAGDIGIYLGLREEFDASENPFHKVFILGLGVVQTVFEDEMDVLS